MAFFPRKKAIRLWGNTLADWLATSVIPANREVCYITDLHSIFTGDGVSTPTQLITAGAYAPLQDDALAASVLTTGFSNQKRGLGISSQQVLGSGGVYLTFFRAPKSETVANIKMVSGTTAAGATPTLVKYALFSVAANGDITRIGITASDTGIFAAASTAYTRALLAGAAVVAGSIYASAMLCVTAAAAPSVISTPGVSAGSSGALGLISPKLCGIVLAQADIAASYTNAQITQATPRYYAELTP